jgi:hypothetical protein
LLPNQGLQRVLYDYQVSCTHKYKGCEWTGKLRELDNHLNLDPPADCGKALQGCPYTLIKCPLGKDVKAHADEIITRSEAADHVKPEQRIASMENKVSDLIKRITELRIHIENQSSELIKITAWLGQSQQPVEHVIGTIKPVGAEFQARTDFDKDKRDDDWLSHYLYTGYKKVHHRDKKAHVRDKVFMRISSDVPEIQSVQTEDASVRRKQRMKNLVSKAVASKPQPFGQPHWQPGRYVTGTYRPVGAQFTMTDFDEYKRDDDVWYSPHFYTHPNGYKMYLRIDANGNASGRGTHLSVFVCLMQGEFDDQLKWPFQGNITIKLANQEEDRDHVIQTFYSRDAGERCERVMTKERINNGWGIGRFLSHAELQPKYLKNNCIILCIRKIDLH